EPLLHADIAVTAACRARDTLRAGCRARAFTRLARDAARDLDLDGVARDRLLERELELVAQVRAAGHLRAAARPGAEDVAEHVAEDVAERVPAAEAARPDAGVTETVVCRALRVVRKRLVGLLGLLELAFGLGIA